MLRTFCLAALFTLSCVNGITQSNIVQVSVRVDQFHPDILRQRVAAAMSLNTSDVTIEGSLGDAYDTNRVHVYLSFRTASYAYHFAQSVSALPTYVVGFSLEDPKQILHVPVEALPGYNGPPRSNSGAPIIAILLIVFGVICLVSAVVCLVQRRRAGADTSPPDHSNVLKELAIPFLTESADPPLSPVPFIGYQTKNGVYRPVGVSPPAKREESPVFEVEGPYSPALPQRFMPYYLQQQRKVSQSTDQKTAATATNCKQKETTTTACSSTAGNTNNSALVNSNSDQQLQMEQTAPVVGVRPAGQTTKQFWGQHQQTSCGVGSGSKDSEATTRVQSVTNSNKLSSNTPGYSLTKYRRSLLLSSSRIMCNHEKERAPTTTGSIGSEGILGTPSPPPPPPSFMIPIYGDKPQPIPEYQPSTPSPEPGNGPPTFDLFPTEIETYADGYIML